VKVLLDGRGAARGGTGIATYVRALVEAFAELAPEVRCLCYRGERAAYRKLGARPWATPSGRLFRPWQLPRVAVTHGPNFKALARAHAKWLITVHDLGFLHFPDDYPPAVRAELTQALDQHQWNVHTAVCNSAATESDVLDAFPGFRGRTTVIHLGVAESWFLDPKPQEIDETLTSLGLASPYIFHLGAMVPRKDLPTLVSAWTLLRRERPELGLVLAGPDARNWRSDADAVARIASSAPNAGAGMRVLGHVDVQVARRLMAAASAYVITSKLEGFGLPALEAMAAGVPVVATRNAATIEVAHDTVAYAAIGDPESVATAIAHTLDNPQPERIAAARAAARGYSWRRCAEKTLTVYRTAAEGG
jgi:glycosyltransferase involved in cell wall biosynthesis